MGVIHKLKPEIKNWVLDKKKVTPNLSCRQVVVLLEKDLKVTASKSSINSIFKAAGLSMPIGRRLEKKRRKIEAPLIPPQLAFKMGEMIKLIAAPAPAEKSVEAPKQPSLEMPTEISPKIPLETAKEPAVEIPAEISAEVPPEAKPTGPILLRAADYLIGGSYYISETIRSRLNVRDKDLLTKVENLIYAPEAGLKGLEGVNALTQDIGKKLSVILEETRCIEVHLAEGDIFYLDGQLHTLWSTPHIPYDFANTSRNIKSYISKCFYEDKPFILFMAPGYDTPTKELFNFILSLNSSGKKITRLILCGNKLEHLENIPLDQNKRRSFIFGLWPWQFIGHRKIKKIGEFTPFYFEAQSKNFYLLKIEVELTAPFANYPVILTGCALKTNPTEKTRLLILSNSSFSSPDELATLYLNRWPNLEEAFQDFSHKVELFTYTANSQRFFSAQGLELGEIASGADIKEALNKYFKALDLYARWHFLPLGYEDQDFSLLKEQFYDLQIILKKQKDCHVVTFQLPPGYSSQKALEYLCRRLNEKEVTLDDCGRLWFLP